MTIEEEFKQYKIDIGRIRLKQARKTAVVLAVFICLFLISLVYALHENTKMNKKMVELESLKDQLIECESR